MQDNVGRVGQTSGKSGGHPTEERRLVNKTLWEVGDNYNFYPHYQRTANTFYSMCMPKTKVFSDIWGLFVLYFELDYDCSVKKYHFNFDFKSE